MLTVLPQRGLNRSNTGILRALFTVASLGAVNFLTRESSDYLVETGSAVSQPREQIANMDPVLPEPPDWVGPSAMTVGIDI